MIVALVVVPASSSATESNPALSGVLPGSGYVAVTVDWSGVGELQFELAREAAPYGAKSYGVAVVRPDGTWWSVIIQSSGALGNADCLVVRSDATGSVEDSCDPSLMQRTVFAPSPGGRGGRVVVKVSEADGDAAGTWTLVNWQAFRPGWQTPGSWRLTGDAEVLGMTTSDRAFVVTAPDFEQGQAVSASFAGAFVSANVGSRLDFDIEDTLFGVMMPDLVTGRTPGMSLHGPRGTQSCTCSFVSPMASPEAASGAYVVELNRVAGGLQLATEATVFVMDLRLPE